MSCTPNPASGATKIDMDCKRSDARRAAMDAEFITEVVLAIIHSDLRSVEAAQASLSSAALTLERFAGEFTRSIIPTKVVRLTLEASTRMRSVWLPIDGDNLALAQLGGGYHTLLQSTDEDHLQMRVVSLKVRYFRLKLRVSRLRPAIENAVSIDDAPTLNSYARSLLDDCLNYKVTDVEELVVADDYLTLAKGLAQLGDLPLARLALQNAHHALRHFKGSFEASLDVSVLRGVLASLSKELAMGYT